MATQTAEPLATEAAAREPFTPPVPLALRGLHLGVLYALAVSQPLLNLLGNNANFFTSRRLGSDRVLAFAVVVALVIPLGLIVIDTLAGLVHRWVGWIVHVLLFSGLALLLFAQVVRKSVHMSSGATIAAAALLAAILTLIYTRSAQLRSITSLFSPLPVLVLLLFLFGTDAHRIVFPGSTAAAKVEAHGQVPIVMVVFDEFTGTSLLDKHNRIDPVLYPNFARLAKDGTYYRNFTSEADETTRVISGLLTGNMWHEHALPIAADYPHNLFTLLGNSYRMHVSEEASNLCPSKICHEEAASSSSVFKDAGLVYLHQIAPRGLEKKLTPVNETLGKFGDEDATPADTDIHRNDKQTILRNLGGGGRPARFEQWLQGIDGTVDRTLDFKHVLLPHVPWQYLPDGRVYRVRAQEYINNVNHEQSYGDKWLLEQGYQRHLLQLGFVDKLIGQLIARLKKLGIYDKALIVVTADNGESFLHLNHDRHIADRVTFTDIASAPLFIKRPFQKKGGYSDQHVRTFDVVPTIADIVGVQMPWQVTGHSVLRGGIPERVAVHREQGRQGNIFSISLAGYEQARRRALARKVALFGSDGQGPGLFGIGPNHELIGQPLSGLQVSRSTALHGQLNSDIRGLLAKVDTKSAFIPANVTGTITGAGAQRGIPLALALNGKIAAVGWSAKLSGDKHVYFTFFAPPSAFRSGANDAEVFSVAGSGAAPTLEQIL